MEIELTNYEIESIDTFNLVNDSLNSKIELIMIYLKNSNNLYYKIDIDLLFNDFILDVNKNLNRINKLANQIKNQNWINKELHSILNKQYRNFINFIDCKFEKLSNNFIKNRVEYFFINEFFDKIILHILQSNSFLIEDELDIFNE